MLGRADTVITVNSKSGAEGLLLGRPVIVLGDAFYTPCHLVYRPASLGALPGMLAELLSRPSRNDPEGIRRYFQDVWAHSCRGEIYDSSRENIAGLCDALTEVIT